MGMGVNPGLCDDSNGSMGIYYIGLQPLCRSNGRAESGPKMIYYCAHCNSPARYYENSDFVYQHNYGPVWVCREYPYCNSYEKADREGRPLGLICNKRTKNLRRKVWKQHFKSIFLSEVDKAPAWEFLSRIIGKKVTSLKQMDDKDCERFIYFCKERFSE